MSNQFSIVPAKVYTCGDRYTAYPFECIKKAYADNDIPTRVVLFSDGSECMFNVTGNIFLSDINTLKCELAMLIPYLKVTSKVKAQLLHSLTKS